MPLTLDQMRKLARRDSAPEPKVINYSPELTPRLFHSDDSWFRGIMGPFGSGKSVCCANEIVFRSIVQKPQSDGIRKSRWGVVRNTFPELKTTTIKTWMDWWEPFTTINMAGPIIGTFTLGPLTDGTYVYLELIFLALDKPRDVRKLKSLELTGLWFNEASEISRIMIEVGGSRIGRYPKKSDGGPSWWGMIADTNPPSDIHWWYEYAETNTPRKYKFWKQPPAIIEASRKQIKPGYYEKEYKINPNCENLIHQPAGADYWLDQANGKAEEWIKVYLMGEYGTLVGGKPVYPEYVDTMHCAPDLTAIKDINIILGWDFGLTPAVVICQITPVGQFRVIDELVVDEHGKMGIRQFAKNVVKPYLKEHYQDWLDKGLVDSVGDPAGVQRSQADDEVTCLIILGEELDEIGVNTMPAPTNSFIARKDAISTMLTTWADRNDERGVYTPGFLICKKCKIVRSGFRGGYRYKQLQVSSGDGEERYKLEPEKDRHSHPHDALQYAALVHEMVVHKDEGKQSKEEERIKNLEKEDFIDPFEKYVRDSPDYLAEGGAGSLDLIETIT